MGCKLKQNRHGRLAFQIRFKGFKTFTREATLTGFDRQIIDVFQAHHTQGSAFNPWHNAVMQQLGAMVAMFRPVPPAKPDVTNGRPVPPVEAAKPTAVIGGA